MLSATDKALARLAWREGPSALYDEGFTPEEAVNFWARTDVRSFIQTLEQQFNHREALQQREKYDLRRQLGKSGRKALKVLEDALEGPRWTRDANGRFLKTERGDFDQETPEVTPAQLLAAREVLNRLGVDENKFNLVNIADQQVRMLYEQVAAKTKYEDDPDARTPEQQVLSRERVRMVMNALANVVHEKHDEVRDKLRPDQAGSGNKKKRKMIESKSASGSE